MRIAERSLFSVITPMVLHFLTSQAVVALFGRYCDMAELTAITAALLVPVAIFLYRREIMQYQDRERKKTGKRDLIYAALLGIIVSQTLTWVINVSGMIQYFSNETQEKLFNGKFLVQILGSCVFVPITEEILFRGLTYQRMKRMAGMQWGIVLSSLLFAIYHGNLIQMLYAFPMALFLCAVYEKCDSIKGPIAVHMAANLSAVILNDFR